jgi:hypothetical protein
MTTGNWPHGKCHGQQREPKRHGNTHVANFSAGDYGCGQPGEDQNKCAKQLRSVFHATFTSGKFRQKPKSSNSWPHGVTVTAHPSANISFEMSAEILHGRSCFGTYLCWCQSDAWK